MAGISALYRALGVMAGILVLDLVFPVAKVDIWALGLAV